MSKRIEIEGVERTVDEWREVLAWVDDPVQHPVPDILWWHPYKRLMVLPRAPESEPSDLTPELVEKIRDAVEPWTVVRREEVEPGERFRDRYAPIERIAGCPGSDEHWNIASNRTNLVRRDVRVLVRRPLKPALTLGEVPDGAEVRRADNDRVALVGCLRVGVGSLEKRQVWCDHESLWWRADTPVEIVEGEP